MLVVPCYNRKFNEWIYLQRIVNLRCIVVFQTTVPAIVLLPFLTSVITCCAKLIEFDWFRRMPLIRNCTGKIRAKTCNCDLIGCFCHAKSCNCYLIGYFCCAKTCNSPWLDNFGWRSFQCFDFRTPSSIFYRRKVHDVTLPRQRKNWSIMATSGRNCRWSLLLQAWKKHCFTTRVSCFMNDCIST